LGKIGAKVLVANPKAHIWKSRESLKRLQTIELPIMLG